MMTALKINTTVDSARPHRKRKTKEHLQKRSEKKTWTAGFKYSW